jgi:hypothetical protein
VIRAHQPGSEPIDIPETIPNPVVVPKPTPTPTEPAPKEPVRAPERVPTADSCASNVPWTAKARSWTSSLNHGETATRRSSWKSMARRSIIAHRCKGGGCDRNQNSRDLPQMTYPSPTFDRASSVTLVPPVSEVSNVSP